MSATTAAPAPMPAALLTAPTAAAADAAAELASCIAADDLIAAARARDAFFAAHDHLDARTLHSALALLLVQQHATHPVDFRRAAYAGVVFDGDCLQAAIVRTRPGDYDVWCPRAQAYVGPRIAAYMQCVRALLDLGAHRSAVPAENPPLLTAVNTTWLNLELLALLLAVGCDPNGTGVSGMTPLMMVAFNKTTTPRQRAAAAARLVEAGADVNAQCDAGISALHYAVLAHNTDMFRVLASLKADMNTPAEVTPLMFAVSRGHNGCLRKLVEAGADVRFVYFKTEPQPVYVDAVSLAITGDNFAALAILLELGAEIHDEILNSATELLCEDGLGKVISEGMRQFLAERVALKQRVARAKAAAQEMGMEEEVVAALEAVGTGTSAGVADGGGKGGTSAKRNRRRRKKQERALEQLLAAGQRDMPPVREGDQPPSAAPVEGQRDVPLVSEADQPPSAAPVEGQRDVALVSDADQPPSAVVAAGQGDVPPVREADQPPSAAPVEGQRDVELVSEADQPPSAVVAAGQGDVPPVREADQPPSAAARVWGNKPRAVMQAGPQGGRESEVAATTMEMGPVDHDLDLPLAEECVICLGARRTTAMDPCGHYCVCDACAASCLGAGCPLCRGVVEKTLRIYL